ncbi:hypothetical protein Vadar_000261 [Vaccinium darrowii]|uniref:Uncharacterized protein n=1 Tax=Vaccinium darrowii TaxID=229202 RepID=A0ACB7YRN7_9ERIC|nr:hypothetical protein Vadar_000261 [Vaccinium darrowii]
MVNGTLESHLREAHNNPLLWKKRLEICIDIARGVKYLHTNIEKQVIHHNITPSNVFLDDKWVAKVGNFEFSLPIPTDIAIAGLFNIYKATKKSDVYAFGVLMLQLLCAKGPSTPGLHTGPFHLWFSRCLKRGTIDEVIDPYLIGKIAPECFRLYVDIALCCLVRESIRRPSMDDVLESLQSSLQLQEAWESSIEMDDELPVTNVSSSYNYVIPLDSEFTIGEQSFLISDLVRPWAIISPSFSEPCADLCLDSGD